MSKITNRERLQNSFHNDAVGTPITERTHIEPRVRFSRTLLIIQADYYWVSNAL